MLSLTVWSFVIFFCSLPVVFFCMALLELERPLWQGLCYVIKNVWDCNTFTTGFLIFIIIGNIVYFSLRAVANETGAFFFLINGEFFFF